MVPPQLKIDAIFAGVSSDGPAQVWEQPFTVTLTNAAPVAAFVWVETKFAGHWSDNGFMLTEPVKTLTFFADTHKNGGNITAAQLKSTLKPWQKAGQGGMWSLTDTSHEYTQGAAYPPL